MLASAALAMQMGTEEVTKFGKQGDCPVRPWTTKQSKRRENFIPVKFDQPFSTTPQVFVAFAGEDVKLDGKIKTSVRLSTEARDITPEGFTLYVGTWCYTKVYWAKVQWIAAEAD